MPTNLLDVFPLILAWQGGGGDEAAAAAGIGIFLCYMVFIVLLSVAGLLLTIANLYYNFMALDKLPIQFRQMEPYQVLFLLIPIFGVIWNFFVFTKVPASLQSYFYAKGRVDVGDCGQQLGLWTAITAIVCPCVTIITLPMYILKIKSLQEQI
jgi:hypothetical protein